ncbi:MAG: FtsX-like permease family protein, partial [Acidimicrobiia bacterium]|nr:FtsX-like permease family protein [Acidimicrobiia bacterium]
VGMPPLVDQHVDIVTVDSGTAPGPADAITDGQNQRTGRFDGPVGATVSIEDNTGQLHRLTVSGVGDTMALTDLAMQRVVLYVPQETANALAGSRGVNSIELTVDDHRDVAAVADAVRSELLRIEPNIVFEQLPDIRQQGTWPGQDIFNNFSTLFYVGAVLALISAMVLISNTMTTMVAEQVREVAIMKAIGGRRRQIIRSFLSSVVLLAVAGSLAGVALGVPFSNLMVGFVSRQFYGTDPRWGVSLPVILVSIAIGVIGSALAALPALRRAARISVRQGMDISSGVGASSGLDRLVRRVPLRRNARVGLRNMTRRRARSIGTLVQVGLAVGVAVGFLTLGTTVASVTASTWDKMTWDVLVSQRSNVDLDNRAAQVISGLNDVDIVQPTLYNSLEVDGAQLESWGLPPDTALYHPEIASGRWLEAADAGQPVAVIGRALAATSGTQVGDTLTVGTARGNADLTVVGIDSVLMNNATTIFLPLDTFQGLLARSGTNAFWVTSRNKEDANIDRLATQIEDTLAVAGYPVTTEIRYVEREANLAENRILINVLAAMGIPIVAIGMIGLVNLMTMNVLERTREIGILRCIGARARDIRWIFRSEAIAIAIAGWVLAIPLGWIIGRTLVWVVTRVFNFGSVGFIFPLWSLPVALVATIALAAIVVLAPVRRAARLKPGDALRYE